jgi:3-hydroxyacyl-CoA dehydrogenase
MTDLVQLTSDNGIAIITINNPPVNALSPGVPKGISEALDQIAQNAIIVGGRLRGCALRTSILLYQRLRLPCPSWRPDVACPRLGPQTGLRPSLLISPSAW